MARHTMTMARHTMTMEDYTQVAPFGLCALPVELPTWPALSQHGRASSGGGILSGLTCVSAACALPTTAQTVPGLMNLCTDRASMRLWECCEIVYLLSPGFK